MINTDNDMRIFCSILTLSNIWLKIMEGNKIYIFFFINPGKNFAIRSLEYLLWIFWSSSWSLSADAVCPVYSVSEVNDEP